MSGQWVLAGTAVTTAVPLLQLQSPTNLSNLTADPPEDLTVLRVVGDFQVQLTIVTANWSLALIVADVTWTPGATIAVDNDKRILWQMTYVSIDSVVNWIPPGTFLDTGVVTMAPREAVHIDIAPKVKVEAGKALYLVAYENVAGGTLTTSSATMRVLYQRSGRRSR